MAADLKIVQSDVPLATTGATPPAGRAVQSGSGAFEEVRGRVAGDRVITGPTAGQRLAGVTGPVRAGVAGGVHGRTKDSVGKAKADAVLAALMEMLVARA